MPGNPQQTQPLGNFNYASLQSLMVFWSVPRSVVTPLLEDTGLQAGIFDGNALVNLNFERYAGFGSGYSSYVNECEFNAVVLPIERAGTEPALTVQQYLQGADQSKTYGNFRINVPCDNGPAVKAGSEKYGEIKFVAAFDFKVPDVNDPDVSGWSIRAFATPAAPQGGLPYIFDLKVNTPGASSVAAFSPVPAYANLMVDGKRHMITSARNVFGVFQSWIPKPTSPGKTPPLPAGSALLTIGDAQHVMRDQMASVFNGNPPAVGILLFESQPAASSSHTLLKNPVQ
jgi:hypothetical protein